METISGFVRIEKRTIMLDGHIMTSSNEGDMTAFLSFSYEKLCINYPKFFKMDNLSKLGFIAAEILLQGYPVDVYQPEETALVLSNSHSSLDADLRYYEASQKVPSPALFVYTLPNIVTGEICIRHGIKGEGAFFVSEELDAGFLFNYVDQLFKTQNIRACLAGWVNVLHDHHDVLLYLVEREEKGLRLPHTPEEINSLYR